MGRPNLLILSIYIAGVRLSLASESVNFGKNDFPASLRRSGSSEFAGMDRAPVGFSILNEVLRRENEHPEWSDPKGDADLDHYTEMMRTQSSGFVVPCFRGAVSGSDTGMPLAGAWSVMQLQPARIPNRVLHTCSNTVRSSSNDPFSPSPPAVTLSRPSP
eukprot:952737-Rhodomonas_salina.1